VSSVLNQSSCVSSYMQSVAHDGRKQLIGVTVQRADPCTLVQSKMSPDKDAIQGLLQ